MLTTHGFQHISLGKEGVPSATCFMLCALIQKDQVHSHEPNTEVHSLHKQTRSQSDQTRTFHSRGRSVQIARGTRLRLSPSIRCQVSTSRSSQAQSGTVISSNTDTCRRPTSLCEVASTNKDGGARRDRTDDLMLAKHALSQLSYGPKPGARRIKHLSLNPNSPHPSHTTLDYPSDHGGPGKI